MQSHQLWTHAGPLFLYLFGDPNERHELGVCGGVLEPSEVHPLEEDGDHVWTQSGAPENQSVLDGTGVGGVHITRQVRSQLPHQEVRRRCKTTSTHGNRQQYRRWVVVFKISLQLTNK